MDQSTNQTTQTNQKPSIETVFTKLFTTIFQEVSSISNELKEKNEEKEPGTPNNSQDSNTDPGGCFADPVIDIPEENKKEQEQNKCEFPLCDLADMLTETFGDNCEKLEESMKDLGKNIREALSMANMLPVIRKFYLEELKTCGTEETNKKTIEKFGLKDTTKFELDLRIL